MTRRQFYGGVFAVFVIGLTLIVNFPDVALTILTPAVPLAIIGATLATIYLYRVYRRQPEPRSRFWLMLLETFCALIAVGGWVGYLSFARILERLRLEGQDVFSLPAPPPSVSSPRHRSGSRSRRGSFVAGGTGGSSIAT